jgi:inward rectifier potassium channel
VGAPRTPIRDLYHAIMRLSWIATLVLVTAGYGAVNALFAWAFWVVGGVANAGSFRECFFFSVQTLGTIGYGSMYPQSNGANLLVVVESTLGLVLTALATGLVFAKFSRPNARVLFSSRAAITPINGVPTLVFRVGNRRSNRIVEAQIRVALMRTEITQEKKVFYRMLDLTLVRERILSLQRAWTVQHVIDEKSPLWQQTPESLAEQEVELLITVAGIDDIWMQTVHASHRYVVGDIVWGARHADIVSDQDEEVVLDLRRFDEIELTEPTENFPYPR